MPHSFELNKAHLAQCQNPASPQIVVAASGGVDSSVALLLLKRTGYDVTAVFMKNWHEPSASGRCNWEDDVADALDVCEQLDIPINAIDLSQDYWDSVFAEFLVEYRRGRTPNPDVLCNREIKFKAFLDHARSIGGDLIATGHYAQTAPQAGEFLLLKGADRAKDQSYFLHSISQTALQRTVFPIGALTKREVREIAAQAGLSTHDKKDSTGICFIGERRFRDFLRSYVGSQPGDIKTTDGEIVGRHQGVIYYTLGQREGLGIGGVKGARDGPWYVIEKDLDNKTLIVAQGNEHAGLMNRRLIADSVSWIANRPPPRPFPCHAKTRYRQADQACLIDEIEDGQFVVDFDVPQRALTPGQSVVFYDGECCFGGGVIDAVE